MAIEIVHFGIHEHNEHEAQADAIVLPLIETAERLFNERFVRGVANEWLKSMPWKRSLGFMIYKDLFNSSKQRRLVVEVGGSLSGLTLKLIDNAEYTLIEKVTHEVPDDYKKVEEMVGKKFCFLGDWSDYEVSEEIDTLIASDIFPNVDQRIYEFIDKFLPHTRELRMTLTYYEGTCFEVKRVSSGEILIMKPWGVREIKSFLEYIVSRYPHFCHGADLKGITSAVVYENLQGRLFSNRRNIIYLYLDKS